MAGGRPSHRAHACLNSKKRRKLRQRVIDFWGDLCFYCSKELKPHEITMDHYWPLKLCCDLDIPTWLREHITNKRVSCGECNNEKGDSIPGSMDEFWFWVDTQILNRKLEEL
jgi:5-methylcytosine-specific restriction endonuclease McrA